MNVTGSFIAGSFTVLTDPDGRWLVSPSFRQSFMIGICGGYRTFSSFSVQTLRLAPKDAVLLMGGGLGTLEKVKVIHYRPRKIRVTENGSVL